MFAPANCLQAVTEDNPDLLSSFNASAQQVLETVMLCPETTMKHVLLRTLIAGMMFEGIHSFVLDSTGSNGGWERCEIKSFNLLSS